jgi:hypothetical protein
MRSLWLGILLAAVESLAFGQLDSDTLTVSVSQSVNLQPDQVVFEIRVTTPATTGLDEVVASLKNDAVKFSGVTSSRDHATLTWFFTLAVPFSKLAATAAQLDAQKIPFYVQGSQVSAESQQAQQCPVSSLMVAAKLRAKQVADAAELVVGDILTLSSGNPMTTSSRISVPTPILNLDPTGGSPIPSVVPSFPIQPAITSNCTLIMKFKLLRYH